MEHPVELAAKHELPDYECSGRLEPSAQWAEWLPGYAPLNACTIITTDEGNPQIVTGFIVYVPYILSAAQTSRRVAFSEKNWKQDRSADKQKFEQLAERWESATGHLSPSRGMAHPAFADMKAMGDQIIPWVLARLEHKAAWSLLLNQLVKNPPDIQAGGDTIKLKAGWIEWGREHDHI